MLASILKTSVADIITVNIMRAFVQMKIFLGDTLVEQKYINNQVLLNTDSIIKTNILVNDFNKKFDDLKNAFKEQNQNKPLTYYKGQIYDAYSKICDIFNEAKEELVIIDGYADKIVLDMISKLNIKVTLITKKLKNLSVLDIEKYNKQYSNLKVIYSDDWHDRYFIIDKKVIYHMGSSINHAGSRTFSINKLDDEFILLTILKKI